jgi:CRISPR/Cas system-associated exonuclease Cas4 (RecB family)
MQLIPIRKKFQYQHLERNDGPNGRTYGSQMLPSVTTILSATKDKTELKAWAERVGQEEADRIRNEAATVGTHMHNVVERLLLNRPLEVPRTWLAVKGYWMGYKLIETFFPNVQEVWGTEIPLHYPGKYAGTSDCIGVYRGAESIIDFKQTNKMKQRGWIEDYFIQLAAYAAAHNVAHGTNIRQGIILMVAQDGETKEFLTCGREFDGYINQWMRRVDQYVAQKEAPGVPGLKDSTSEGENE